MASLTTLPNSPYWVARMKVWVTVEDHPQGGFYRRTFRSTKVKVKSARRTAQRVADEMERTACELRDMKPDKAWFEARVAALMRASGVEAPVERTNWKNAAAGWLRAKDAKPRSIERYESDIAHFTAFLGVRAGHDLRGVTPDDVSRFYQSLLASGLSATTAQHITKTIRSVFRRAVLLRRIESNPAELLRMRGGKSAVQRQPFSKADLDTIFSHLKTEHPEWRTACLFGLCYGMRIGDAVRRRIEEIDTVDGIPCLQFVPEKKSWRGKTVSVPLVGELEKLTQRLTGKGYITPHLASLPNPSKEFGKVLGRSKLKRKKSEKTAQGRGITDKTFHSFRHTINSLLVDTGADQRVRQLICDHDDAKVNAHYTHASLATMAAAIDKAISRGTVPK
jgi:site-specific recombinase XerD